MSVLPTLSHSLLRDVLSKVAQSRITAQELQASLHSQLSGGINVINHGPALQIAMFPCLQDNYGYLVKYGGSDAGSGGSNSGSPPAVFCVDVPEALLLPAPVGWSDVAVALATPSSSRGQDGQPPPDNHKVWNFRYELKKKDIKVFIGELTKPIKVRCCWEAP